MRNTMFFVLTAFAAPFVAACDSDEVDICSDDLDCDDGLYCEITGQDDGVCIEGVTD
ncbi:MAG: hypothetical protein KC656_24435 [Myxococcales bacterium]|nr:hypothetical protein [Myxococcales bacterium]